MTRPLLIVNPASSGGQSGRMFDALRPVVERSLGACDVVLTERSGHATELARAAAADRETIIAFGGDGTWSELVAGVVGSGKRPKLGLFHLGTGGDFRRSLGLEHRPAEYLDVLKRGRVKALDVGRVVHQDQAGNEAIRHFANVASIGMGGLVDKSVAEGTRMFGPTATYFAASLKALVQGVVGRLRCEVTLRGETTTHYVATRSLAFCNGRYFGGGMHVAPMAHLDDGVLELIAIGGESRLGTLAASPALYAGTHLGRSDVKHLRAESVVVTMENPSDSGRFQLDLDGEWAGGAPLTVSVLPRAVDVIC